MTKNFNINEKTFIISKECGVAQYVLTKKCNNQWEDTIIFDTYVGCLLDILKDYENSQIENSYDIDGVTYHVELCHNGTFTLTVVLPIKSGLTLKSRTNYFEFEYGEDALEFILLYASHVTI